MTPAVISIRNFPITISENGLGEVIKKSQRLGNILSMAVEYENDSPTRVKIRFATAADIPPTKSAVPGEKSASKCIVPPPVPSSMPAVEESHESTSQNDMDESEGILEQIARNGPLSTAEGTHTDAFVCETNPSTRAMGMQSSDEFSQRRRSETFASETYIYQGENAGTDSRCPIIGVHSTNGKVTTTKNSGQKFSLTPPVPKPCIEQSMYNPVFEVYSEDESPSHDNGSSSGVDRTGNENFSTLASDTIYVPAKRAQSQSRPASPSTPSDPQCRFHIPEGGDLRCLYISNLSERASRTQLKEVLDRCGVVLGIRRYMAFNGRALTYAFVWMQTAEQARQVIDQVDGVKLAGATLCVRVARPRGNGGNRTAQV